MVLEDGERAHRSRETIPDREDQKMLTATLVTVLIALSMAFALRSPKDGELIAKRPYENRYNDAAGARQSRLG